MTIRGGVSNYIKVFMLHLPTDRRDYSQNVLKSKGLIKLTVENTEMEDKPLRLFDSIDVPRIQHLSSDILYITGQANHNHLY